MMPRALSILALVLAGALPAAWSAEAAVVVSAGTDLRLVVVDQAKAGPQRDAIHRAFAASLEKAVGDAGSGQLAVKVKCVSADNAAFSLQGGGCDAVLVLGSAVPRPLVLSETTRLTATLGTDKSERKAWLIFSKADQTLEKLLAGTFVTAVTDTRFLDALDGGLDPGTRIAASGR